MKDIAKFPFLSKESAAFIAPLLVLSLGLPCILLTMHSLSGYSPALGKETISMFIPLLASMAYMFILCFFGRLTPRTLLFVFGLYIVLLVPFGTHLGDPIEYNVKDDAYVFSTTARNMVENRTLWGGDGLLSNEPDVRHFLKQPGYRYYVALWIGLFGPETRLFQFFNMFICLLCISILFHNLLLSGLDRKILIGVLTFIGLSSPFIAKLVLMGIGEWLALVLLSLGTIFFIRERYLLSMTFISLAPFFRQNLVVTSFLLFIVLIIRAKRKLPVFLVYATLTLLPLFHNLYYAGQFRFLSDYRKVGRVMLFTDPGDPLLLTAARNLLYHLSLYSGIDYRSDMLTNIVALTFIPAGVILVAYMARRLKGFLRNEYLFFIFASAAPTLLFGWAYYPRFEYVNLYVAVLLYIILSNSRPIQEKTA